MRRNIRIGDVLIEYGCATHEQVDEAIKVQSQDRSKRLGEILLEMGVVTEEQLLYALGERLNIEVIDYNDTALDLSVVEMIPHNISQKYGMLAIRKEGNDILLAVNDPMDFYAIEDMKSFLQEQSEIVLCRKKDIQKMIDKSYAEINARKAANKVGQGHIGHRFSKVEDIGTLENGEESPVVSLVNTIIVKAYSDGVSDIHFEPFEEFLKIRFRVDGQLFEYMKLDVDMANQITTRIKILAELDIAERRVPQDGNMKVKIGKDEVGIRVSVMPTVFGEKLVLRFLSQAVKLDHIGQFGMNQSNYDKIQKLMRHPHGIIYVTGPTGSGKTTTLYMMLESMSKGDINISTIEDPVERNLPGITQVQVNTKAGVTFETGLRSMLRQDPDVILVGETRDAETAQIAVSAAITGHLVLSTLHTNDAISSVVRLSDMGIKNYLIANSVVGVVAQRLLKKVCPLCREVEHATEMDRMYIPGLQEKAVAIGCKSCNNGYKGRIAVHEILEIDKDIRSMIANGVNTEEIYTHIRETGKMNFLTENISELVIEGVTTMEEYYKHSAFEV